MKKYTGHKKNYVSNFFNNCKKLEQNRKNLERQYHDTKAQLLLMEKNGSNPSDIYAMKSRLHEIKLKLNKTNNACKIKNETISRLAVALGLSATILASTVSLAYNYKLDSSFHNNFVEGYSYTQENENNSSDISYLNFKNDLEKYVKLSNKEQLSGTERQELNNTKSRIYSSPKEITQYALEVLKTKIADSLNIDDFNRIRIYNNSHQVNTDANHSQKGSIQDITIFIDGNPEYSRKSFESLMSGEIRTDSDTIPKEVLKAIRQVVTAQRDPQNLKLAYKALETALQLDSKDLSFDQQEFDRN